MSISYYQLLFIFPRVVKQCTYALGLISKQLISVGNLNQVPFISLFHQIQLSYLKSFHIWLLSMPQVDHLPFLNAISKYDYSCWNFQMLTCSSLYNDHIPI